jgi:hypothetical protein
LKEFESLYSGFSLEAIGCLEGRHAEDSRIIGMSGELWPGMGHYQASAIGRILTEGITWNTSGAVFEKHG